MILKYLKSAFRSFGRNKIASLINIFGMSIGLASIILICNWVYYEYSFDKFHNNKDRIYRLIEKQSFDGQDEQYLSSIPEWLVGTFEEDINGVESSTALFNVGSIWFGDNDNQIEVKNVTFTNNSFFKIFTLQFISGSPENALINPQCIVIVESLARKLFQDISPVGKTILYQNKKAYTITGVIEDIPNNSHFQTEMLVSIEERKPGWNQEDYNHTTNIYLLLDEDTDPVTLWKPLQQSKEKYMPNNAEFVEFQIQPLSDIHLFSKHTMWGQNWKKSDILLVKAFILIGIFVMIISTINYINLSTAAVSKRFKEFGLRKIVGSSKINLIIQFLFESFVLLFISFWLSLLIIELLKPVLIEIHLIEQSLNLYQSIEFLFLMILFIFILSIVAGIYPAIILSSVKPVDLFKKNLSNIKNSFSIRKILVITQLSITTILTITVLFITKQMLFMQHKEMGYKSEAVINFYSGDIFRQNYETIKTDILTHNSILNVTSSNIPLGTSMWRNCIHFEGEQENDQWVTPYMMVDYNFFEFYDIQVTQGRTFSEDIALDKNHEAFLVNESLANEMGSENIIGRKFRTCNSKWGEVVGVIKDFNYRSLHHEIEPLAIQLGLDYRNLVSVKVSINDMQNAITLLEETWKAYQPDQPFRYSFLDENLNNLYASEKRTVRIVSIFSVISIIISCIGLLGLIMSVSESKTKEIGIRKVNGASVINVLKLLSGELISNVSIALIIAVPIGWYTVNLWRDNFAYKSTISWWIFALSGLLILIIAWLTISYHTIKAARKNPIEALRYE